ncbi:MAG: heme-binding protein [Chthoniobacterales bacterium]|nr:heme-binding protein [Chthoniobacterales bacterium]
MKNIRPLLALLATMLAGNTVMATETPDYKVLTRDGAFEVREYPALTTVRTSAGNGDFMRLFRYISGENEAQQKIAMTAPVLMTSEGEKSAMSFIVPRSVAAGKVPSPKDEAVTTGTVPAGRFAVYRYSGRRNDANEKQALEALRAWVDKHRLEITGSPLFGYYDPPWTLPFLRRNEVMLPVAGPQP